MDRPATRLQAWLDMMLLDHGVLRLTWRNLYEIDDGVWRSNQPSPRQMRQLVRDHGIKTIINLRGESDWGQYLLEVDEAKKLGIEIIDCRLFSRKPPSIQEVERFMEILDRVERPFLMHCKSGADRAGLGAALYMLWKGRPPREAAKQLSWKHLHVKQAKTGMLDEFIEAYAKAYDAHGISFKKWLHTEYNKRKMMREFKADSLSSFVVDRVLMRE